MKTYLCRWPHGLFSIVSAADEKSLTQELSADNVCSLEQARRDGGVIFELPEGFQFRIHFAWTTEGDLEVWKWSFGEEAARKLDELFPNIAALKGAEFKTKKAAKKAIAKALALDAGQEPK